MFLNEVGKRMTDQSSQSRHKRKGKKNNTDNSNVLENPPPPQRTQTRAHRPSRQLEFNQAMEDFSNMFPRLDREVIESVLRANNGAVDITIDQLLVLDQGTESQEDLTPGTPDSNQMFLPNPYPLHQPPLFGHDKPPPYSPPSPNSPFCKFNAEPDNNAAAVTQSNAAIIRPDAGIAHPAVSPDIQDPFSLSAYPPPLPPRRKKYEPALLGPLPDDFLRLPLRAAAPPQPQPVQRNQQQAASSDLRERSAENMRAPNSVQRSDKKSSSRPDDEKIALLLQSNEFLEELLRHSDFMSSIDRDYRSTVQEIGLAVTGLNLDNINIRDKLPYMSKSTKSKLSSIAKKYTKKKKKAARLNSPQSSNTPAAQNVPPADAFGPPRRLNDNTKRQAESNMYASLHAFAPHGS